MNLNTLKLSVEIFFQMITFNYFYVTPHLREHISAVDSELWVWFNHIRRFLLSLIFKYINFRIQTLPISKWIDNYIKLTNFSTTIFSLMNRNANKLKWNSAIVLIITGRNLNINLSLGWILIHFFYNYFIFILFDRLNLLKSPQDTVPRKAMRYRNIFALFKISCTTRMHR